MIIDKFLTRKGWRVVAHSMLAGCGVAFLYIIVSGIVRDSSYAENGPNPWILGIEIVLSLWLVALGTLLTRSELGNKE